MRNLMRLFLWSCLISVNQLVAQKKDIPFADFYVSTKGNDLWSGKLPEPNATQTDGPFASLGRAKIEVRLIKKDLYRNIFILIRGGEYQLSETEIFSPLDSHYDSFQIVYKAYPNENPVFSSDAVINGWQLAKSVTNLPTKAKAG